jgi:uncharacterized protein with von Willebrand factor type A (vWA) domain
MKTTTNVTMSIELSVEEARNILSDFDINTDAVLVTDFTQATNEFLQKLKEMRGDYDRVGF